jgi:DNA-binding beta-propeller fold protein YncE
MSPRWYWLLLAACPLLALAGPRPAEKAEPHRSPYDLALLPGGRLALTANHTADSASLVDLAEGKVLAEAPCGRKPASVAVSADGKRAAVSNLWSDTLSLFEIDGVKLRPLGEVAVGHQPRGVAFAPDGKSLFVALAGADEVAQLDWAKREVARRLPAPREPRRVAVTKDGKRLVAASMRSSQVRCWDAATSKLAWERAVDNAFNLLGLALTPDDLEVVTAQVHTRHHPIVKHNIEQGWALNSRLARMTVAPGSSSYSQIALDIRNKAVGDPTAVTFTDKGDLLAVAAAGTQEVLLVQAEPIPWNAGEAGDFLDSSLDQDDGKFRRVALGGRPLEVKFTPDGGRAVVANYLLDAVQVIDVKAGKVAKVIALGGPAKPSEARLGEAVFYDAKRSHHQWFSCHTCHPDGHTCGRAFDTLNDDSQSNPKMTPTLRGVARTAPYTWHGWQEDLGDAVEKSITETLWGKEPSKADVRAVVAFLRTLDHPPSPHLVKGKRSAAAQRGKALFEGKARCARCHQGEDYTSKANYDVKLPADGSPFERWNPPALPGVYDRGPYLHDGGAETLDDLLRGPHAPEKLGGAALSDGERRDLVAFLKSL